LIASSLPSILQPSQEPEKSAQNAQTPLQSTRPDYTIRIIVHPSPVRVAYATAATLLPQLITNYQPDYVLHMGMAAGRDHYTLETVAHRDNYKIKDIDERDGWREGEHAWKREGIPDLLYVGWNQADVLKRWEEAIWEVEERLGLVDSSPGSTPGGSRSNKSSGAKSVVRLSRDAGRYLCEFALMSSLSRRWLQARKDESNSGETPQRPDLDSCEGKVGFLHVPGGHTPEDISRGVRVAEAAIRSIVGSWEAGLRRVNAKSSEVKIQVGRWDGVVWQT
jgi:hypothetical protein